MQTTIKLLLCDHSKNVISQNSPLWIYVFIVLDREQLLQRALFDVGRQYASAQLHPSRRVLVVGYSWTELYPSNDDKAWLLRLNTNNLNYIRCPNPNRMKQSKTDDQIRKKYQSSKVNVMRCNRSS